MKLNIHAVAAAIATLILILAPTAGAAERAIYLQAQCTGTHCPGTHGKALHSNSREGGGTSWGGRYPQYSWVVEFTQDPSVEGQIVFLRAHCTGPNCPGTHGRYMHSNSPEGGGFSWGGRDRE